MPSLLTPLLPRRRALGLSQWELAATSGVRWSIVSELESGNEEIALSSLAPLLVVLGMKLVLEPGKTAAQYEGATPPRTLDGRRDRKDQPVTPREMVEQSTAGISDLAVDWAPAIADLAAFPRPRRGAQVRACLPGRLSRDLSSLWPDVDLTDPAVDWSELPLVAGLPVDVQFRWVSAFASLERATPTRRWPADLAVHAVAGMRGGPPMLRDALQVMLSDPNDGLPVTYLDAEQGTAAIRSARELAELALQDAPAPDAAQL